MSRVLIECSYVFDHPGDNSGIQRVVRCVVAELKGMSLPVETSALAFRGGEPFLVKSLTPGWFERVVAKSRTMGRPIDRKAIAMADKVHSTLGLPHYMRGGLRSLFAGGARVLTSPRHLFWLVTPEDLSQMRLTRYEPKVGDQLVLLDSSWHGQVQAAIGKLRDRGVGVTAVIYDLVPITHPQYCVDDLVRVFRDWFAWVSRSADGYLAISKDVLDGAKPRVLRLGGERPVWFDWFHLGAQKLDLVTGPVNPEVTALFAGAEPVYLMVGTIEPRKNHVYALDAFERYWAAGGAAKLCLVGKAGWKVEAFMQRLHSHPEYGRRLFVFNRLDDAALEHAYGHAKALIYPSRAEGFGLPMIEAMQHGLPVMASDIPIFHETGGDFAAYFDLAEPQSLADLLAAFEAKGEFPAKRPLSEWAGRDWRATARDIVEKTAANAIARPLVNLPKPAKVKVKGLSPFNRALAMADAFRDDRQWSEAAKAYRRVLAINPGLAGIWVQLGHALKESGRPMAAHTAYMHAKGLDPDDPDIEVQLGHVWTWMHQPKKATKHYLRALALDPSLPLGAELGRSAGGPSIPGADLSGYGRPPEKPGEIYFDLMDALDHFQAATRPTGIQRVQIETVAARLADQAAPDTVRICVYSRRQRGWVELPHKLFTDLHTAVQQPDGAGDVAVRAAVGNLYFYVNQAPALIFPTSATLINLGSSWTAETYFEDLQREKARSGIAYAPVVYDLIPMKRPEFCTIGTVGSFMIWLSSVLDHADFFLAISESTRRDLLDATGFLGRPVKGKDVAVVSLDAQFRQEVTSAPMRLVELGIDRPFVLMVSTLEPRKNHLAALSAWRKLAKDMAPAQPPLLVLAGRWGWRTDEIHAAVSEAGELALVLTGLADEDIGRLYEACLFTVFPSHYEGWGLPVTESLCYGKVALTADNSSLPEAGGEFADYFEADDVETFARKARRLIEETAYREAREARIAKSYRPRPWREVADDIEAAVKRVR